LEARGGWDEADLNDFALIEASLARLEQVERQLDKLGEEWHAVNNRAHAAEARVEQVEQERDVEERFANAYRRQLETAEAALREIADGEQNGTWRVRRIERGANLMRSLQRVDLHRS
jgi:chromosome segregation ATPase